MSRLSVEHIQDIKTSLNKLADRLERDYKYYAENKSLFAKGTAIGSGVAMLSGAGATLLPFVGVALSPVILPLGVGGAVLAGVSGIAGYGTKVAEQSAYDEYLNLAQTKLSVYASSLVNESRSLGDKRNKDGDVRVNNVLGILSPFIEAASFSIRRGSTKLFGSAALAFATTVGVGAAAFQFVTLTFNISDFVKNRIDAEQARKGESEIKSALAMEIRKIADDLEKELQRREGA